MDKKYIIFAIIVIIVLVVIGIQLSNTSAYELGYYKQNYKSTDQKRINRT